VRWFLTPYPWLVIGLSLVLMTAGTFALGAGDCSDALELVTSEERVECYLAQIAAGQAASWVDEALPVVLVVGTALAAVALAKAAA
jgi:hypothetical protein